MRGCCSGVVGERGEEVREREDGVYRVDEAEHGSEDDVFGGVEEADWFSTETDPAEQVVDSRNTAHTIDEEPWKSGQSIPCDSIYRRIIRPTTSHLNYHGSTFTLEIIFWRHPNQNSLLINPHSLSWCNF